MKVINETNLDTGYLKELIKFCQPSGVTNFTIEFREDSKRMRSYGGKAYTWKNFVSIKHFPDKKYPYTREKQKPMIYTQWKRPPNTKTYNEDGSFTITTHMPMKTNIIRYPKGYLGYTIYTETERLIHIIAHELRHLWQKDHKGKRGKVWGARGRYSERDADAYGIRKVREYRQNGLYFNN